MSRTKLERAWHDRVAEVPCVLCARLGEHTWPVQVHHVREGQGTAQRAPHVLSVALCPSCHAGPDGFHGSRTLLRIAKVEELDLLADTIEAVFRRLA